MISLTSVRLSRGCFGSGASKSLGRRNSLLNASLYNVKPVDYEIVDLNASSTGTSIGSHSYGRFLAAHRNIAIRFRFNPLHFPFGCGWYAVVLFLFDSESHTEIRETAALNCTPRFECRFFKTPYCAIYSECTTQPIVAANW